MKKQQGPKITIITACYNSEKTIEQTIQSVLNQTYGNIEYIIIDGASTDGTMDVVVKYWDQIDAVVSEQDCGVYDAFNKGVHLATGEYTLFLNSDDYFYRDNVIKLLVDFIRINNNPVGVYGEILKINEQTGYMDKYSIEIDLDKMKDGIMPPHPATLLKNNVITEFGGFDLQYGIAADFDLLSKVFYKYEKEIYYHPVVISVFRLGGLSSHRDTLSITKSETKKIINKHFPDYETRYNEGIDYTNEFYLKKWLEQVVFQNKSFGSSLKERKVKSVVIFGSGEMALLIAQDLIKNGIQVIGFLDNNEQRQGILMNSVGVYPPEWLKGNIGRIDAVIFGFQGFHEKDAKRQIDTYDFEIEIPCFSWRELIV